MSRAPNSEADATNEITSDRGGLGGSVPAADADVRNYNSQPCELRATDSDQRREQTHDGSAGWRTVYRQHGIEPEGWRE